MRLIDITTQSLIEFTGRDIPEYAILSHTWEEEEIPYIRPGEPWPTSGKGYSKVRAACHLARTAKLQYLWVDTCCIDKSSSAELSEAINSMYKWYQRARVCFVYLSDLDRTESLSDALPRCRWFTRGWTLQELIAPMNVQFYDQDWNLRGSKLEWAEILSGITSISQPILLHQSALRSVAVAERLSWAANRQTSRIEDIAYCLLGIFEVNMPLLYGEEDRAFRRLQETIIQSIPDLSIFAWRRSIDEQGHEPADQRQFCGLLSMSPDEFAWAIGIQKQRIYAQREFSVTNLGIKTFLQILLKYFPGDQSYQYVLPLDCTDRGGNSLSILLRKCGADMFVRENPCLIMEGINDLEPEELRERYLLSELPECECCPNPAIFSIAHSRSHALQVKMPSGFQIYEVWPSNRYDDEDQLFFLQNDTGWDVAVLQLDGRVRCRDGHKSTLVNAKCMLYVVGWSSGDARFLQSTIIDYNKFRGSISEMQASLYKYNYNSYETLSILDKYDIPKSSSVAFEIANTGYSICVTFNITPVKDLSLCRNDFWVLKADSSVHKTNEVPLGKVSRWNFNLLRIRSSTAD